MKICHKTGKDVHNISERYHSRIGQHTNDLVKFGCVDFELCEWTDEQTKV